MEIKGWAVVNTEGKPIQEVTRGYEIFTTKKQAEYSRMSRFLKVKPCTITIKE